jgi:uncharacterized protein YcbX
VRRAFLTPFGLLGDRRHAVVDETDEPLTARRDHALLGFAARCGDPESGARVAVTTPGGLQRDWDDPAVAAEASQALRRPVRLVHDAMGLHDAAPLHLASTSSLAEACDWIAGEEVDPRRFRVNLIVELEDPEPYAEAGWLGATLRMGGDAGPVVQVVLPTERCVITTFDPDTLERDNRVLAALARERENLFGVYARVRRPGWTEVGATIRRTAPAHASA